MQNADNLFQIDKMENHLLHFQTEMNKIESSNCRIRCTLGLCTAPKHWIKDTHREDDEPR